VEELENVLGGQSVNAVLGVLKETSTMKQ